MVFVRPCPLSCHIKVSLTKIDFQFMFGTKLPVNHNDNKI